MASEELSGATEPAADDIDNREFVADNRYSRRVASALLRQSLLRPTAIVGLCVVLVGSVVVGAMIGLVVLDDWRPGAVIAFVVAAMTLPVALYRLYRRVVASVSSFASEGTRYSGSVGADSFRVITTLSTSETSFSAFEGAVVRDGLVLLKHHKSRIYTILPAEIFPVDFVDRVNRFIAAHQAR